MTNGNAGAHAGLRGRVVAVDEASDLGLSLVDAGQRSEDAHSAYDPESIRVRNTFYEFFDSASLPSTFRRSKSEPPPLSRAPEHNGHDEDSASIDAESSSTWKSSDPEKRSDDDAEVIIFTGMPTPVRNGSDPNTSLGRIATARERQDIVHLGDFFALEEAGLPSIGSIGHQEGTCRPCKFSNLRRRNSGARPCWKGFMCDRCHVPAHGGNARKSSLRHHTSDAAAVAVGSGV